MNNQDHGQDSIGSSIGEYDPGLIESLACDMSNMTSHYSLSNDTQADGALLVVTDHLDDSVFQGNNL